MKGRGHEFQEFARSGGAAVVHLELGHLAVAQERYDLGVLPPDIQNGSRLWEQPAHSQGIGLNFRDGRDLKPGEGFRKEFSTIAGGNNPVRFHPMHDPLTLPQWIEGRGNLDLTDLSAVQKDQLNGAGTDVYSGNSLRVSHDWPSSHKTVRRPAAQRIISTKASTRVLSCSMSSML